MDENFILSPLAEETCEASNGCPLLGNRFVRKQVPTEVHRGGQNKKGMGVDVMFIAEAPGRVENEVGRPVIGGTGKILRQLVDKLNGGTERGVAYGNIVRCRPVQDDDPRKDRAPTTKEVVHCRRNILHDIMKIKPAYIVLLGGSSAVGLASNKSTGEPIDPNSKVFQLRGKEVVVKTPDGESYPAIVTFHFAFVSRTPKMGGVFEEDIARAFYRARGIVPDYSKRGDKVVMVNTVERVFKLLKYMATKLTKEQIVAFDYEAAGLDRIDNKIITVGFAYGPDKAFVIPYKHPESPWTGKELREVRALLRKFFTTRNAPFRALVAHNLKFECALTLDEFGVSLWNLPLEDTMLRAHALNENRKGVVQSPFGLKTLSDEWLGFKGYYDEDIVPMRKLIKMKGHTLEEGPIEQVCEYNGMDCYVTWRLHDMQDRIAHQQKYRSTLKQLGLNMHGPVSMFAARMEHNGIRADKEQLRYLMAKDSPIVGRIAKIEEDFASRDTVKEANKLLLQQVKRTRGMAGIWGNQAKDPWLFHINKTASQKALFVDVLHLPTQVTPKSNQPKIDKTFYKENKGVAEVDLASEWAALDKLRGTYIESPYKMLQTSPEMRDGRIRAAFNFHKTTTGRTSSSDPNMQNIPKGKTVNALAVKRVYTVEARHLMVCVDYSQAEVRWLAQVTGDPLLKKAFEAVAQVQKAYLENPTEENRIRMLQEGDFHRQTASQIFDKPAHEITDDERSASKAIVFGIIYGMSVFGIAEALKISFKEAENYQEKFLNQFPKARKWLYWIEKHGFDKGYVESAIGRRRHLVSGFVSTDDNQFFDVNGKRVITDIGKYKGYEDRVCRNAPIQAIASDTNLMACIAIQRYIEEHQRPWRLLNIVHDSIIAEIPRDDVEDYMKVSDRIMVDPHLMKPFGLTMSIPFVVDFSIGPNWADQINVDIQEKYSVNCPECKKERKETAYPKNKRCEECGCKEVEVQLKSGPLPKVLSYWDWWQRKQNVQARA